MGKYYGDFATSKTVRIRFNTRNPRTNAPDSLVGGTAVISKDGSDVTPSGGVTLTADVGSVVGRNSITIDMSVDTTTFTAGSEYSVRLGGTPLVGGTTVLGHIVGEWSVANRFDSLNNAASGYTSTQVGGAVASIKTATDKFLFDGSNFVKANIQAYGSNLAPDYLVWNALLSTYNTSLTFGNKVQGLSGGGGADPWDVALPGSYISGKAGNILGNLISNWLGTAIPSSPTPGTVGEAYKVMDSLGQASPVCVQSPAGASGVSNSLSASFGAATVAGNFLVAVIGCGTSNTVTGPAGWTLAGTKTGASNIVSIYTLANAPSQTTVTASSAGGTAHWTMNVLEFSGMGAAPAVDATSAGGTTDSGAVTTTASDLIVAALCSVSGGTYSVPTGGFTLASQANVASTTTAALYRLATATGSYTAGCGGVTANAGIAVAFKVSVSAFKDPWSVALPGPYASGAAGYIVGTNLNATVTSRQPSGNVTIAGYAAGQDPATLVLGATASSWNTSLTIGAKINSAAAGGTDPWSVTLPGSYTSLQAGSILGNWITNFFGTAVPTSPTASTIGEAYKFAETRLDAAITSRQPSGNVTIAGYASGQDPATLVLGATASSWNTTLTIGSKINAAASSGDPWSANLPGAYAAGTAGYMLGAVNTKVGLLQLDGSNNIYANVKDYYTGQSPGALVWGASTSYNTAGTMGGLQNSPIVAGYATGQAPDYLTWNATLVTYNGASTFGNKVQALANAADPWTATVGTGYTSTQAGYFLNLVKVAAGKLTFDSNNSVQSHVYDYESGQSPDDLVWDAMGTAHAGTGTMGGLLNAASGGGGGGTGTDPWATTLGTGGYTSGQAGYVVNTIGNIVNRFGFDSFSNVLTSVAAYGTNLAPDYLVWNASGSTYNTTGTMGKLQNGSIVAGYATGQDPTALVWGVTTAGNNTAGTMGARLQSITNTDPWGVAVGTGYTSTQAGYMLNQLSGRVDGTISGIPSALFAASVESGVTFLQAMRAVAADAAGAVARVGSSNQFQVMPIGNPASPPRMVGTMDSQYLTRTINSLAL